MKKILIILLCLVSLPLSAAYYVANAAGGGNDAHPGTIAEPWLTWSRAFTSVSPGDTVYFRGGVYPISKLDNEGERGFVSGTAGSWVYFWAYPGEIPILDASGSTALVTYNRAIYAQNEHYMHLKGLHIRNVNQSQYPQSCFGIYFTLCSNIIFEDMHIYNIEGVAYEMTNYSDTILIKNCDAHNMCDSINTPACGQNGAPGQNGNGYHFNSQSDPNSVLIYQSCRVWDFADNGFGGMSNGFVAFYNCWAYNGGRMCGDGNGFKFASAYAGTSTKNPAREVFNCIAVNCFDDGFTDNYTTSDIRMICHIYNNIAYHNGYSTVPYYPTTLGYGYIMFYTTDPTVTETYRNNIAFDDENGPIWAGHPVIHSNNTWDHTITVTAADFVSLDTTQLRGARKAWDNPDDPNGLPDITFGTLVSNSDLIDKGVNVGLPYSGDYPDIGYSEFVGYTATDPMISTVAPNTITSISAKSGGYLIYDGGGTITAKGICWGTSVNPDLTDNVIGGGTGTDAFELTIIGLTANTTYHVRAYATNSVSTQYGLDEEFTTDKFSYVFSRRFGDKQVYDNDKRTITK